MGVKVKFKDGSVAEIDDQLLPKAKEAGATVIDEPVKNEPAKGTISVRFKDGSTAQIAENLKDKALQQGAEIIEPVKKKDGGDIGQIGQKAESSDSTGPLPSAGKGLAAASSLGETPEKPKKYFDEMVASSEEAKPILSSKKKQTPVTLSYEGETFVISPDRVPEGYEKTVEGARKYASDVNSVINYDKINKESGMSLMDKPTDDVKNETIKNLVKTDIQSKYDLDDFSLNSSDLDKISEVLGDDVSLENGESLLQRLKEKRDTEKNVAHGVNPIADKKYEDLIRKVSHSLTKEVEGDGYVNTFAGDTESALRGAFKTQPDQVKSVVERMSSEKMTNALATGIESLKYSDPEYYEILKRRISQGKTISSSKAAELTSIGAKIIEQRQIEALAKNEISIDDYVEKSKQLSQVVADNLYKRPDVLQKYVSDVIAKYYQGSNPLFGQWHISDKEIDGVPVEEYAKAGIDYSKPEVQTAINNIKKNEGVLPFDNAVQKDSWAREAWRGFAQPIKGTVDFLANIPASSDTKRLQKEMEGSDVSDYISQRSDWFNKTYGGIADAFNGAGQFVSQYLLMEAGVGLFKNIGTAAGGSNLYKLIRTPESAALSSVRSGGTKFGNYIVDHAEMMSRLAVPFVQSYDQYHKDALMKTDNPWAARAVAFTNSSMEALSEQMFDNLKFGREVVANFRGTATDKIAQIFKKGITEETADQLKNVIKDGLKKSIQIVGKGVKDLSSEAIEEVPVTAANFITDALLNPSLVENRDILEEMKDSFVAGLVSFSIPTLIGTGSRLRKQFSSPASEKDALMVAARNRSSVLDAIYNQLEDGYIDQEEANSRIQLLNTATSTLRDVPPVYATGRKMDEEDRVEYLSLSVKEKYLKEQNSKLEEGDPILLANKINLLSIQEAKKDLFFKGSGVVKTPEEILLGEAAAKRLSGGYSELLAEKPEMAGDVLLEYAKQIYGVNHDGSDMQSSKFFNNENVEIAVTKKYPTRQSVIDAIAPVTPAQVDEKDIETLFPRNRATSAEFRSHQGERFEISMKPVDINDSKKGYIVNVAKSLKDGRYLHSEALSQEFETKKEAEDYALQLIEKDKPISEQRNVVDETVSEVAEVPDPDNGITVSEMIDKPGRYRGMKGMFYVDQENEVIFKEEGKPKEYVLGMVDDVADRPIDDFGIQHETSVVETDEEGSIIVRGQKYVNNYSDPMMAINETKKGYTVTLETADGKKRTFRGSIGEDIAYQIHLQQITKNNEQEQFQAFVSSDPEAVESLQNGGYTEVAPQAAAQADAEVPAVEREVIEPKDEQARDEEAKIMEDAQLEQDAIDQEAEAEKVQAIKEATKPMISLPFAESTDLIGKMGKDRLKNVNRQKKLEEKFNKLIDLIDCIYG